MEPVNPFPYKILQNAAELEQVLATLRIASLDMTHTSSIYFPQVNNSDLLFLDAFNNSVLPELGSGAVRFETVFGEIILHYPIKFVVRVSSGMYLNEDNSHAVPDGDGYPAFFPREMLAIKNLEIRGRMSLTTYQSNVSPAILAKLTNMDMYDPGTIGAFQNCLQLRSQQDALWGVRNQARSASVGDNHLAVLIRAYMYYFDSLHLVSENTAAKRLGQEMAGFPYNVLRDPGWVNIVAQTFSEIVNCLGMPLDYTSFWTFCCLPMNECYVYLKDSSDQECSSP